MTVIPKTFEIKRKPGGGRELTGLYFDGVEFPYGTIPGSLTVTPHPATAQCSVVTVSILVDGPIQIGEDIEVT